MPCGKLKYVVTDKINIDNFFGFLEVDIEVPKHLYNNVGEFPPIVKNLEYSSEICGDYTNNLSQNNPIKPRKLVATLKGEKV